NDGKSSLSLIFGAVGGGFDIVVV
ncbi:unnamed protein product, partial [Rotaria magnacalcarata]